CRELRGCYNEEVDIENELNWKLRVNHRKTAAGVHVQMLAVKRCLLLTPHLIKSLSVGSDYSHLIWFFWLVSTHWDH
ncbi:hypothetical protein PROFUN_17160, partial [Planoprotostelium fungivorum]